MKWVLKLGHVFSAEGLLSHFLTDYVNIDEFVMMILPMPILCSLVLGVPCSSAIAVYLEITLKKFSMESELM